MEDQSINPEWKKGSAELLLLSLLDGQQRHGYEIGKLIELRSHGELRFHAASLYPLLYRLERRGWIQGRWVEKSGQRQRRFYQLTAQGRKSLAAQRQGWQAFVNAISQVIKVENAWDREVNHARLVCNHPQTVGAFTPVSSTRVRDR
jgi:PadR family transcriptional regulator, regulatory protein PadR